MECRELELHSFLVAQIFSIVVAELGVNSWQHCKTKVEMIYVAHRPRGEARVTSINSFGERADIIYDVHKEGE